MPIDETVAVLGAGGTMGLPIARNIARAGGRVRAWNRSVEKARPLAADGAFVADSAAQAVQGATVVLTMLSDVDVVVTTMDAAAGDLSAGALWLQMSTIGEAGTQRCTELADQHGLVFFDAPVLGTKQPAEEGKLVVLASGPEAGRQRVQHIFDAIGQKTVWLGEAGAGNRLKVVANSWVVSVTEACAEMIALAEAMGVDPHLALEAFDGGPLDQPYLRMKAKAIVERDFSPKFALRLAAKDAGLIEESAERHGAHLPLFSVVRRQMLEAAKEHGNEDISATYFASAV
jgi:3-hydroxyisobutyrate dehydrogenase